MSYFKRLTVGRAAVWLLLACCTALLTAAYPDSAAAARKPKPKFQIKFATLAPDGSTWMNTMHEIDDELRARTDNRLGFKFYPGGVQGDEKEVLRKIRNGQLHGGGFSGFGIGSIVSEVRIQELPFLFESLDELDYVRTHLDPEFHAMFADKGFLNLGWADVGFIYVFSKDPIATPAELNDAKMWIWAGDPLAELFFNAFDLSPIPLSAPDVLTSLQTGMIDAVYSATLSCIALQWFTKVGYMTDVPITHGLGAALISEKGLRKVDPADVEVLMEIARPKLRDLTEKTRIQNREALDELKKEGIQVVPVTDAVRTEFFTTGQKAGADGVGKIYSQEILDRVKALLADYRAGKAAESPNAGS